MKTKEVILNSLFGIIGILVLWQLYSVLIAVAYNFFRVRFVYGIGLWISIAVIITGFVIGVHARQRNNQFYKIFQPNKHNIIVALVVSLLLLSYLYTSFRGFFPHRGFTPFPIHVLISAVIFYPFSALSLYTLRNWKQKAFSKYSTIAIITIILISPPVLQYSSHFKVSYHSMNIFSYYSKGGCGAYVYGFMENAPAQAAGMEVGEIIKEIDGKEIKVLQDIKDITYSLIESKELTVVTDKGTYEITTVFDPVKNKQRIGTNVKHKLCGKYRGKFIK